MCAQQPTNAITRPVSLYVWVQTDDNKIINQCECVCGVECGAQQIVLPTSRREHFSLRRQPTTDHYSDYSRKNS